MPKIGWANVSVRAETRKVLENLRAKLGLRSWDELFLILIDAYNRVSANTSAAASRDYRTNESANAPSRKVRFNGGFIQYDVKEPGRFIAAVKQRDSNLDCFYRPEDEECSKFAVLCLRPEKISEVIRELNKEGAKPQDVSKEILVKTLLDFGLIYYDSGAKAWRET
ncbi:MAG: hypothetical protein QW689_08100 [Nitrososphaerota archaeon]